MISVNGNPNVPIQLTGSKAYTVIAFCYWLIIIYALTLAPVCWIYAAEVWSLETRPTGMGIAAFGNWLFNFAMSQYILPGFKNIHYGLFRDFRCLCVLVAIHFFLAYPDTCGKTLEEIGFMFSKEGPKPWHTHRGESLLDQMVAQPREKGITSDGLRHGSMASSSTSDPENVAHSEQAETEAGKLQDRLTQR